MKSNLPPFFLVILLLLLAACQSATEKNDLENKFSDPIMVKIHDFADRGIIDSLLPYLMHPQTKFRYEAAFVCANVVDTLVVPKLQNLLQDPDLLVRAVAAFSLGQNPGANASKLIWAYQRESDSETKVNLLEAIGKSMKLIDAGLPKKSLHPEDHVFLDTLPVLGPEEQEGLGKAMYWLHYRGLVDLSLMDRIPFVLQRAQGDAKVSLAFAMSRHRDASWFANNQEYIFNWLKSERNAEVRITLMSMVGAIANEMALKTLLAYAGNVSEDMRVRQAALQNCSRCNSVSCDQLMPIVAEKEGQLALIALGIMTKKASQEEADAVANLCTAREAEVVAASMKLLDAARPGEGYKRLVILEEQAQNHFDKVHFIRAMGACSGNDQLIHEIIFSGISRSSTPMLKTAYGDALTEYIHGLERPLAKEETQTLTQWLVNDFENQDPGLQASLATLIYEEASVLKGQFENAQFLKNALNKLVLPREIESYNEVLHAIASVEGTPFEAKKLDFNHPIDWAKVMIQGKQKTARVKTNKGEFLMVLDVEKAPGSVMNFIELVDAGYFNHKYFHRVVPNFVVQTGCPRGDGFGSLDYTIRSEFGTHDYSTGAVGLASAGKDTESCQWFVTHLPTPGLEGRYTIIGYVTEGMETIHKIRIGDSIEAITWE